MAAFLVIPANLLHSGDRVNAATWQDAIRSHCEERHSEGRFAAIPLSEIRLARSTVTQPEATVAIQPDP